MNSPISTPDMAFEPLEFGTAPMIDAVGPGYMRLGSVVLRGPLLLSPWGAQPWGGFADTAVPLTLVGRIDVLLLGGGKTIALAPRAFRDAMEAAGIGVEPMATATAARQYNLLIGEGRRVALVAFPLPEVAG